MQKRIEKIKENKSREKKRRRKENIRKDNKRKKRTGHKNIFFFYYNKQLDKDKKSRNWNKKSVRQVVIGNKIIITIMKGK